MPDEELRKISVVLNIMLLKQTVEFEQPEFYIKEFSEANIKYRDENLILYKKDKVPTNPSWYELFNEKVWDKRTEIDINRTMDNSYILNQRVGLLRCKNNLNISYPYVYMVTNSEPFLLNLRSRANSGVQVNLSTEQIKLSKLIIPASHINKLFNELITPIFEQIFLINKKNENLKQTRDILLPRLISGEINVENMEVL